MRKFITELENNLGLVVIIGVVLIFVLPPVLSLPAVSSFLELAKGNNVGSAIGGITAPVIGILTCLLVYFTFKQQVNFNAKQLDNQYYQSIEHLINETLNLIDDMEWHNSSGVKALLLFKAVEDIQHTLFDEFYIVLLRFEILEEYVNKIPKENIKDIFEKRIYTLFYTKILWNCYSGLFKEMKNYIHRHDDSVLSMKLYAQLSIRTIRYLLQKKMIVDNSWKQEVISSLNEFSKKA